MRNDRERLLDIQDAIDNIKKVVWSIVEKDMPALEQQVKKLLKE